ncbi:MAG: endonuclease/exonuclease/phosphatase family protein [Bacteroidota bacterium]
MKRIRILLWILLVVPLTAGAQHGDTLRIITYNIWNGFDWGKDTLRASSFQEWMKTMDSDVAALQELCAYNETKLQQEADRWGHSYAVLLKKSGYSVGLTSRYPIELIEKIFEGMHHGALHCRTAGIDFLVVHLHPGSIKKRRKEMQILLKKIAEIRKSGDRFVVLGDFNAHSPFDAHLYDPEGPLLTRMREKGQNKADLTGNLVNNNLDYAVLSGFLSFPLHDVLLPHSTTLWERGSFPGRVLGPLNGESSEQLDARMERIDYILVSESMAPDCVNAKICNGADNWDLSDHYPVIADFSF